MRIKKYFGLVIAICLVLNLSGCGEAFPEMTDEEYDQTVEFAVGLLMKYSNNGQAKLTYVDAKEIAKQREKEARAAARAEAEKNKETKTTQTPATTPVEEKPEPVQEEPNNADVTEAPQMEEKTSDDTTAVQTQETQPAETSDNNDKTETDASSGSQEIVDDSDLVLSSDDSLEVLDNIFLSYQGYSVSGTYPESSKSYVINADKGKKLLVLRFDLYNGSDSAQKVNLLSKNIMFQVILNGKNLGYTAVTMLPNDLASYVGTIDSRAHESLVVLTEIDQSISTEIKTLGLITNINGKEQKVSLK